MLRLRVREFVHDEDGGYTVWSLLWFSIYVAIGGAAVDISDGYRIKTILQATADASALAAVMSLPDQADGRQQAIDYSRNNMLQNFHGTTVRPSDVEFGVWVHAAGTFTPNGVAPNAARVLARRAGGNENPLATNFLRIIGMTEWDVNAAAIAIQFVPECLRAGNALVAGNRVDVTSNNIFDNTCVHAQNLAEDPAHDYAVEIQNNGTIYDGTQISMPNTDDMIDRPTICSNDGLCEPGTIFGADMMPADAFSVEDIVEGMLDPTSTDYLPVDLYSDDPETAEMNPPTYNHLNLSDCEACVEVPPPVEYDPVTGEEIPPDPNASKTYEYTAVMEPGNVYAFTCDDPMDQLVLPSTDLQPVLQDVAIISECRIKGNSNMQLEGVAIGSSAVGGGSKPYNKATISFPSGVQFGLDDDCAPGGGVQLYSGASVHISAAAAINGMRIVARGDVDITANVTADDLNIQAGHNIKLTANGDIGTGCVGDVEGHHAWHYRLVR